MEGMKRDEKDEEEDFYDCHETLEQTQTETPFCDRTDEGGRPFCDRTDEEVTEETREEPQKGLKETEKELTDERINERLSLETQEETQNGRQGDREGAKVGDEETREGCEGEEFRDKMADLKETDKDLEYQECSDRGAVSLRSEEEASGEREEEKREEEVSGEREVSGEKEELQEEEEVQIDEEYQRELEKDLTEEEKEIRREQSLSLKDQGNSLFKTHQWSEACSVYSEALSLCPLCYTCDRSVLYNNRAAARLHLDQKDKAIADCSKALELNPQYLKALLRRAELFEQTEKLDEALDDYNKVLESDPHHTTARHAVQRLPQQIHERNERLKEEMMSKLKDLGNMILRPFGLSTNNFQMNQDQSTGAYNINFVQSPNNNNR